MTAIKLEWRKNECDLEGTNRQPFLRNLVYHASVSFEQTGPRGGGGGGGGGERRRSAFPALNKEFELAKYMNRRWQFLVSLVPPSVQNLLPWK